MEFKIEARTKLAVEIYGQKYDVTKPRVGQVELLNEELTKAQSDVAKVRVMKMFVASLGIPEQILTDLEMDQFTELCEFLAQSKKK